MKNSTRSLFILGSVIGALLVSGCGAKGYRGKMSKAGEATLESKQNATVKGTVMLEDHYGGLLASGKLTGLRADRTYKLVLTQKGDCSARNASSAGSVLAEVSRDGNAAIDKDGKVAGHAKGQSLKAVAGKAVVVVASDEATKKEFRVACGTIKETMKGKQCTDCGMKDCKCDHDKCNCKDKKMKKSEKKTEMKAEKKTETRTQSKTVKRKAAEDVY